jgi:hypothetical protein
MAALPRRQFCGKLHVITPQQVQWKPPLCQAAGTLADTRETTVLKRTEIQREIADRKRKVKVTLSMFFEILI